MLSDFFLYFEYLLFVLVPGLGLGELLHCWRDSWSFSERLAFAFGLGLCVDTAILVVKTSGLSILGYTFIGIGTEVLYVIMLFGFACLLFSLLWRRHFLFLTPVKRHDLVLLGIVLAQIAMISLYFQKYPIFPAFTSTDFMDHVSLAKDMISGSVVYNGSGVTYTIPPYGLLYGAVHYQLAAGFLFTNGIDIVVSERIMAILIVISTLILFETAEILFGRKKFASLVITGLYALSGTVWFVMVFDSGLEPNFFGIIATLFVVGAAVILIQEPSRIVSWITMTLAVVMLYFSHFSDLTVLPALMSMPLIYLILSKKVQGIRNYVFPAVLALVPLGALPLLPGLFNELLNFLDPGSYNYATGSTTLSRHLASVPFLRYTALMISDDVAFVALALLCLLYLWFGIIKKGNKKEVPLFLPLVWSMSIALASPWGTDAWRYSLVGLVPLTLMAGYGLCTFTEMPLGKFNIKLKSLLILILCFGAVLYGSWGQNMTLDSLQNTSLSSSAQNEVYAAMGWLKANTPSNAIYLSVSDWRFNYTNVVIGHHTEYSYMYNASAILEYARSKEANYILVTFYVTKNVPDNESLRPWYTFPGRFTGNVSLIFSNEDVRVYNLTG